MANIKLKNIIICENAIASFDGKVSLINIFTEIKSNGFPIINPRFTILVSINGEVGKYKEILEIISPDGSSIAKVEGQVEINGPGGNNFLANFINTVFSIEGKYWIKVSIDGNILNNKDENFILVEKQN
jgi:hypothetical protein